MRDMDEMDDALEALVSLFFLLGEHPDPQVRYVAEIGLGLIPKEHEAGTVRQG